MYVRMYSHTWKKDNGHNVDTYACKHYTYTHATQMQVRTHTLALHVHPLHTPPVGIHISTSQLSPLLPDHLVHSPWCAIVCACSVLSRSPSWHLLARGKSSLPSSYASAVQSATTIKCEVQRHITYIHRQIVAAASCFTCVLVMSWRVTESDLALAVKTGAVQSGLSW